MQFYIRRYFVLLVLPGVLYDKGMGRILVIELCQNTIKQKYCLLHLIYIQDLGFFCNFYIYFTRSVSYFISADN